MESTQTLAAVVTSLFSSLNKVLSYSNWYTYLTSSCSDYKLFEDKVYLINFHSFSNDFA